MKILILDGVNKNTLAIVRHLGRLKVGRLDVVSYQKLSITFFSRFVSKKIILPRPKDEGLFINALIQLLASEKYDLLIPVGYATFQVCSRNQDEIKKYTKVFVPSPEAMEIAESKIKSQIRAERLGIPVPKTIEVNDISDIQKLDLRYPVVIKAPVELGRSLVSYASDKNELPKKFRQMCTKYDSVQMLPILQEYIDGEGVGFFAYYSNGKCRRIFMHRRIREYPASGGASVCAQGFYDAKLQDYGIRLLDSLKWNGVAMVEFKKNRKTGDYVLMEINPKFWGSLDLSLVSGVVFPYFMVLEAKGEEIKTDFSYHRTMRFQWLLNGEFYHFLECPGSFFRIFRDLFRSKNDIWVNDPMPALFQIMMIPVDLYKKYKK
jgi:predicted ATP-grasp superfamily ATP-dependent carboligase